MREASVTCQSGGGRVPQPVDRVVLLINPILRGWNLELAGSLCYQSI